MGKHERCFRRMTYGKLLWLVENAVEAYLHEHDLDAYEGGDNPDVLEMDRWEWCRGWLHRHMFNK